VLQSSPLTSRAALLAVVLAALVVSLALPVREYVKQRSEIAALDQGNDERRARVAALERQLERWKDPAFVQAQARQRLQYVMPGEVGYVVLEPDEAPSPETIRQQRAAAEAEQNAWYSRLWGSVQAADDAAAPEAAEPAATGQPAEPASD
jgi:cell division protein FtsB